MNQEQFTKILLDFEIRLARMQAATIEFNDARKSLHNLTSDFNKEHRGLRILQDAATEDQVEKINFLFEKYGEFKPYPVWKGKLAF